MKGEMLDNCMDRLCIYTILPGNLPFKKAGCIVKKLGINPVLVVEFVLG
jgi:hypothetical protein